MTNKLKTIFSNEKPSLGGTIHFENHQSYLNFLDILKLVYEDGEVHSVPGVVSVETVATRGESSYPFLEPGAVEDFVVGPAMEQVNYEVETSLGKREIVFDRYWTKDSVVLQTSKYKAVWIKLIVVDNQVNITYATKPYEADDFETIIEEYCIVRAFLEKLFGDEETNLIVDENREKFIEAKQYFEKMAIQYNKVLFLQKELGLCLKPSEVTESRESHIDLEELYALLSKRKAIRVNTSSVQLNTLKLNPSTNISELKIGSALEFTFVCPREYNLWEKTVEIYTANLLTNAIVKEIKEEKSGKLKLLYGSEDSRPMYIAYKGFITEEEASEELQQVMENKDDYIGAKTLGDYLQDEFKWL